MLFASQNVFSGRITSILVDSPYAEVEVSLPSGLKLYAEVESILMEKMGLATGCEATLAVKASHVTLAGEDTAICSKNRFTGRIVGMTYGFSNAHATIETPSGNRISVNLPLDVHPGTWLEKNSLVNAYFDPRNVFVFTKKQS